MQHERDETMRRFDDFFGYGWQAEYARVVGLTRPGVARMSGSTLKHARVVLELLENIAPNQWPDRWAGMRALYLRNYAKKYANEKGT